MKPWILNDIKKGIQYLSHFFLLPENRLIAIQKQSLAANKASFFRLMPGMVPVVLKQHGFMVL